MEKQAHSERQKEEFRCNIDGCKQSFPTEVHRNVHTKKHDLSLNLEMPLKGAVDGLFADQTPTPTRLIGKCEEVGLFEDLQKVNPFDETFRRAVESGASRSPISADQSPSTTIQSVPCCRIGEGETLHTPHIFPTNIDRTAHDVLTGTNENASKQRPKAKASNDFPCAKQNLKTNTGSINADRKHRTKRVALKRRAPFVVDILPKPASLSCSQTINTIPLVGVPSHKKADSDAHLGQVLVKAKLKEHLAKVRETGKWKQEKLSIVKSSNTAEEDRSNDGKSTNPIDLTKSSDEQPDLKHERWKAAAKRYRIRVKKSQDQQHQRNIELEDENLRLRTEIATLKHAHRNCSVMREQKVAATLLQGTITTSVGGALESFVTGQEVSVGTVVYNTNDPQHSIPLSTPQQRLITSHIIDSHSMNRNPIFIVIGAGTEPFAPVASSIALPEKSVQNG